MPSEACPDGCTGTGCFALEFARTLYEYLLDACDLSHALICTLSEYMKILNLRTDHPVKT
jgi:methylase of polypeptide subunit release factors